MRTTAQIESRFRLRICNSLFATAKVASGTRPEAVGMFRRFAADRDTRLALW